MAKKIGIEDLQKGAVLDQDVVDTSGRILLRSGVSIQDNHLSVLQTWGITEVIVLSETVITNEYDNTHAECIHQRFVLNDITSPPMPVLVALCEKAIQAGEAPDDAG